MFLAHCINLNTLNTYQNPHSGSARGLVLWLPLTTIPQSYKSTIFIVSIDNKHWTAIYLVKKKNVSTYFCIGGLAVFLLIIPLYQGKKSVSS